MRLTLMRAAFSLGCLSLAWAQNQHALVLQHATVIDGTGAPPRQNQTVVISGTRIVVIGASGRIRVPDGAQMIDGSGKYLIPGLWRSEERRVGKECRSSGW